MGIWRFAKFLRNARSLACVGNRFSSPKVRHCHDRACHLLALTILIGPDCSTTIRLPLVSISGRHPVAARLVVGPDDASSRLHSKEQPFTFPLTSYMPAVSRYFGFVCRRLGTGVGAAIGVSLLLRPC